MCYRHMESGNKPTVLVVDDEALILLGAVCFLEDAGYHCLEASNAGDAKLLLRSHPDIVALFTDIEMPGSANGLDLAQDTHSIRPDIAVVIASGRICPRPEMLPPNSVFVAKPYKPETVTGALRELLAA